MAEDNAKFPPVDPVKVALTASCPRCGNGKLFDGFSKPKARCNSCGLDLSWVDAGDGPAIFVILLADLLVVGFAVWVELTYQPSMWLHIWLMRFLKALLIALQYKHNASPGVIDRD